MPAKLLIMLMFTTIVTHAVRGYKHGSRMNTLTIRRIRSTLMSTSNRQSPSGDKNDVIVSTKDRPFTLPAGEFRPKQSLGQNYLSDQNYVLKICDAFQDDSEEGSRVVEIGPGMGALTRVLVDRYPRMKAVEIDQRAVAFLNDKLPQLDVIREDVLQFDWPQCAAEKGGTLSVIANLPYYITSQVLFSLADSHKAIDKAVVTMQLEVAERITAPPRTKQYGIPSVVFQLYGRTKLNFKIPPNVFYPVPKVDSGLVTIDFTKPHPDLNTVDGNHLRKVVTSAFRQRRKMLRQSLKGLMESEGLTISEQWATLRPEQLQPEEFIALTKDLYGERGTFVSKQTPTNALKGNARNNSKKAGGRNNNANSNQPRLFGRLRRRAETAAAATTEAATNADNVSITSGNDNDTDNSAMNSPVSTIANEALAVTTQEQTDKESICDPDSSVGGVQSKETESESAVEYGPNDRLYYVSNTVWRKALFG